MNGVQEVGSSNLLTQTIKTSSGCSSGRRFSFLCPFCRRSIDSPSKKLYTIRNPCGSGSMVERRLPKPNVAGSSPVFRSKKRVPRGRSFFARKTGQNSGCSTTRVREPTRSVSSKGRRNAADRRPLTETAAAKSGYDSPSLRTNAKR